MGGASLGQEKTKVAFQEFVSWVFAVRKKEHDIKRLPAI
jgi:hypothetical protein